MFLRMGLQAARGLLGPLRIQPDGLRADQGRGGQPATGRFRIGRDQEGRRRDAGQIQAAAGRNRPAQPEIAALRRQLQNGSRQADRRRPRADLTAQGQTKQRQLQRKNPTTCRPMPPPTGTRFSARAPPEMTEVVKKLAEEKGVDLIVDTIDHPLLQARHGPHQRRHRRLQQGLPRDSGCPGEVI